jgi:hypothetical protein
MKLSPDSPTPRSSPLSAVHASPTVLRDPLDSTSYRSIRQNPPNSFVALLLPHLFPVTPLLHYSYKKMGGAPLFSVSSVFSVISALNPVPVSTLNCHLSTSDCAPPRPYVTPLFSTLSCKPCKNPPLSKSFRLKYFQTLRKVAACKSFRLIAIQKKGEGEARSLRLRILHPDVLDRDRCLPSGRGEFGC